MQSIPLDLLFLFSSSSFFSFSFSAFAASASGYSINSGYKVLSKEYIVWGLQDDSEQSLEQAWWLEPWNPLKKKEKNWLQKTPL